jgi:hypothetical protein
MKATRWISDKYHRLLLMARMLFTSDPLERKALLVAYGMYSVEGRRMLADAMLGGVWQSLREEA